MTEKKTPEQVTEPDVTEDEPIEAPVIKGYDPETGAFNL